MSKFIDTDFVVLKFKMVLFIILLDNMILYDNQKSIVSLNNGLLRVYITNLFNKMIITPFLLFMDSFKEVSYYV